MVAKVHVPDAGGMPARKVLHGHMISFMHDAPKVLDQHFAQRTEDVWRHVQVAFVGPKKRVTNLERKALRN